MHALSQLAATSSYVHFKASSIVIHATTKILMKWIFFFLFFLINLEVDILKCDGNSFDHVCRRFYQPLYKRFHQIGRLVSSMLQVIGVVGFLKGREGMHEDMTELIYLNLLGVQGPIYFLYFFY